MAIRIDFSDLSIIERDALTHAARLAGADVGAEAHITANVNAMIEAAIANYIAERLPGLRGLAVRYLDKDEETREEVRRLLGVQEGEAAGEEQPPPEGQPPS